MLHEPLRTILPCHIVVADDIIPPKSIFFGQVCDQMNIRPVGGVIELAGRILMAVLNRNRVVVRLVGCPGDFSIRNALDDLALQTNDVVRAHVGILEILEALEIIMILLCRRLRIAQVMNDNLLDSICRNSRP